MKDFWLTNEELKELRIAHRAERNRNGYDGESAERDEVLISANAAPLELLQIVNCSYRTVLSLTGKTNPNLDSDLNISLRLLDACKYCCAETLRTNLNIIKDKQYIADTEAMINGGC